METRRDRALGALLGLAVGDALGMPTQTMPRSLVESLYGPGGGLDGFRPGPPQNEISAGLPAGHVTDDTDQAVIVGELLVEGHGHVDPDRLADRLLAWQRRMAAAGSADLLGPSTLRALRLVADGAPVGSTGRWGDTNGAAMRVAPVGVAVPPEPLDRLCDAVADVDRLTHDTTLANAGACAVAAVVSAGVEGADWADALPLGLRAASLGARQGSHVAGADVARRIGWALDLTRGCSDAVLLDLVDGLVGTGVATQESVPAAFAVAANAPGDPWRAGLLAARLGGDSDTVAAMAGAMVGACTGASALPPEAVATVRSVNDLDLEPLVDGLLALRAAAS
ncbi:MAG: ADP-ribosylglycohydrolase family protein [Sporichthyaceae bacterium]